MPTGEKNVPLGRLTLFTRIIYIYIFFLNSYLYMFNLYIFTWSATMFATRACAREGGHDHRVEITLRIIKLSYLPSRLSREQRRRLQRFRTYEIRDLLVSPPLAIDNSIGGSMILQITINK